MYEEHWVETPDILAHGTYGASVDANGDQVSQVVTLQDVTDLRLYRWTRAGIDYWGMEQCGSGSEHIQVYEIRWVPLGTYGSDDYVTLDNPATETDVTLADGTTAVDLTAYRLRTGSLYDDLPLVGVSAADILGDGAVSFAAGLRSAVTAVRNTADNVDELAEQLNSEFRDFFGITDPAVRPFTMRYEDSAFAFDLDLDIILRKGARGNVHRAMRRIIFSRDRDPPELALRQLQDLLQ